MYGVEHIMLHHINGNMVLRVDAALETTLHVMFRNGA
jgi:hypothetical protein